MKVFDIITESRSHLNENIVIMTTFKQMLAYAASKGGAGADNALAWVANALKGKPNAAKEIAEAWIVAAEKLGVSADEAINMGVAAARKKLPDDLIRAARAEAEALADRNLKSIWGQLKTPESKTNFYFGAGFSFANKAMTFWLVAKPIYDCVEGILKVYELRDSGNADMQDDDKMFWAVQWYIDRAVGQITSALLGGAILKKVLGAWVPGVAYNVPVLGKLLAKLDPIYNKLSPAAQTYFKYWITSEEGQQAVAKWLAGELLMPGTEWKIPGGTLFRGAIVNPLSGIIKSGYDAILRMIGSDKAEQLPKPDPSKDKPQSVRRYDLGTGRALNPAY